MKLLTFYACTQLDGNVSLRPSHLIKAKFLASFRNHNHYILTDGNEPTPFYITVAQAVHSLTRSKELVTALNRHGVCVSYNTVKCIDVDLAEKVITIAGGSRVPLPCVFEARSPLNRALDNFDRNESTMAGTGSTHDTILVLF